MEEVLNYDICNNYFHRILMIKIYMKRKKLNIPPELYNKIIFDYFTLSGTNMLNDFYCKLMNRIKTCNFCNHHILKDGIHQLYKRDKPDFMKLDNIFNFIKISPVCDCLFNYDFGDDEEMFFNDTLNHFDDNNNYFYSQLDNNYCDHDQKAKADKEYYDRYNFDYSKILADIDSGSKQNEYVFCGVKSIYKNMNDINKFIPEDIRQFIIDKNITKDMLDTHFERKSPPNRGNCFYKNPEYKYKYTHNNIHIYIRVKIQNIIYQKWSKLEITDCIYYYDEILRADKYYENRFSNLIINRFIRNYYICNDIYINLNEDDENRIKYKLDENIYIINDVHAKNE